MSITTLDECIVLRLKRFNLDAPIKQMIEELGLSKNQQEQLLALVSSALIRTFKIAQARGKGPV